MTKMTVDRPATAIGAVAGTAPRKGMYFRVRPTSHRLPVDRCHPLPAPQIRTEKPASPRPKAGQAVAGALRRSASPKPPDVVSTVLLPAYRPPLLYLRICRLCICARLRDQSQ